MLETIYQIIQTVKANGPIISKPWKNGEEFPSLEKAYDAYLKALGNSEYDSVRQSQS